MSNDALRPIRRLAIVNRGEAAMRCVRTVKALRLRRFPELRAIVLYTDVDRDAPFVRHGDEAVRLESPDGPVRAYLDHDGLMGALRHVNADAVWPGWGFVSEDPAFADRISNAGIRFLGPTGDTMRALGDKIAAKFLAESAGVPVTPWSGGAVADEAEAAVAAERIGYPLMVKASAGGGGRGIRAVNIEPELADAFRAARAEAKLAFGDDRVFLERRMIGGRHIEVQIAGDQHGHLLALGCRDCSVQRRHQKVIEEAPPPHLSAEIVEALCTAALRIARAAGYTGVGTVEFLVGGEEIHFLEVNPRLQVEHGITEVVTGIDLVEIQIAIASGERIDGIAIAERGAAIEARLCAEDPASGFLPSPGRVARFDAALGPGVRVDSGVVVGSEIPSAFDSLIAKVIASGATREEARTRLASVLEDLDLVIERGATNKGYLLELLHSDGFRIGGVDTGWLDRRMADEPRAESREHASHALVAAAILAYQRSRDGARRRFYADPSHIVPSRVPPSVGQQVDLSYGGHAYRLSVYAIGAWRYRVHLGDAGVSATLSSRDGHSARLDVNGRSSRLVYDWNDASLRLEVDGRPFRFGTQGLGVVRAETPALLVALQVKTGDHVTAGQALGVLEAMKMEIAFRAPIAGVVREVSARPGQQVAAGDPLLVIDASPSDSSEAALETIHLPCTDERAPVDSLREEIRRVLLGYDVDEERADELTEFLASPVPERIDRAELAELSSATALFADVEQLFLRAPTSSGGGEVQPSNEARLRTFVRRLRSGGAGIDEGFLDLVRKALSHYRVADLSDPEPLERAVLRLLASRHTADLRHGLMRALLKRLKALAPVARRVKRERSLALALSRIATMRALVGDALADSALETRYALFDAPRLERQLARAGRQAEGSAAKPVEVERLAKFELEELPSSDGLHCFHGRSRDVPGDERIFVFAKVAGKTEPGGRLTPIHLAAFEIVFHRATSALRTILAERDPKRRLQWNRLILLVEPAIALDAEAARLLSEHLAPATRRLGLEKVVIRMSLVETSAPRRRPREHEIVVSDVTGSGMQIEFREPRNAPLEPATDYERKVAEARRRRLVYPYEIIRLQGGEFEEFDLAPGTTKAASVAGRAFGLNRSSVVFGLLRTPTPEVPEGLARVLILSDPTRGMGALAAPECDRITAALDLAEARGLPVEWIPISSGARIAMDSGTENLDATARVVRRIVELTQRGCPIHVIVHGVNVGAQSYWNALATMLPHTRGALVMTPGGSMVLTGRAALEASGSVAAEDEIAIGGFERTAGPNGEAQYYAPNLTAALALLREHYRYTYVAPGEQQPRRYATKDPFDRDVSSYPYSENGDATFRTIGEIFSPDANPGRKKPFAMRRLMSAVIDQDGGWLERWHAWAGAETAIVWDARLGGAPVCLIGIESQSVPRQGYRPFDGPVEWSGGTLYPLSSRKIARALNAASGNRPAVILANLSGFDGSPESLRHLQLEHGAEIARAVVNFDGPILFLVVARYHGGAYVVFSRALNPGLDARAVEGSYASVIGGGPAAKVVFTREVEVRAAADPRVQELRAKLAAGANGTSRAELESAVADARLAAQAQVAAEFDAIHTVERAREVGSLREIIPLRAIRPALIASLERARAKSV